MDFFIHTADLVEARLRGFAGGNFALPQFGAQFGNSQLVEHLIFSHRWTQLATNESKTSAAMGQFVNLCASVLICGFHSTILGTINKPLAWAGALRRASSCGSDGRISSGRVTLTIGTACAVGSTPETSS